jgi:formylglycine-generating enzyme required for sulfatase activity
LKSFAWRRVDPGSNTRIFGEEELALAAASAAVEKTEAGDASSNLAATLETLAWAQFANGDDDAAKNTMSRAVAVASDGLRSGFESSQKDLEEALDQIAGGDVSRTIAELEVTVARLESEVAARRSFSFANEADQFLYTTLSDLHRHIGEFEATVKVDVERRLAWATGIAEWTRAHPNALATWDEAIRAIATADGLTASTLYARSPGAPLRLVPQIGLVPIGMNPVTKLWEFLDLRSACDVAADNDPKKVPIPSHRPDGSILVDGSTGIIFTLLPGGTYLQGSQNLDPEAPNYDPRAAIEDETVGGKPVSVTLHPFFIARHEMTQGQWLRLTGSNPSYWLGAYPKKTGLDRPIEYISWDECKSLLERFGLDMPTEAQWEYACRAGSDKPFSFGGDESQFGQYGNVKDSSYAELVQGTDPASCDAFDDGATIPCAVGNYLPNAFGLYDMHGNVLEMCRDLKGTYANPAREIDGLREPHESTLRIRRGGAFFERAVFARTAPRAYGAPGSRGNGVGIRPIVQPVLETP